jgi:hypothetical protein
MEKFQLNQCSGEMCFRASGSKGHVSMTHDAISATHVKLDLSKSNFALSEVECVSFRYDMSSQFLVCDNREENRMSLTIDSKFVIKKYE